MTGGAAGGSRRTLYLSRRPSSHLLQVDTEVCPYRVQVSNLPRMDEDTLLNKLEIHFSKKKNGGGEVECCELRRDIWTAVVTFVEKNGESGAHQLSKSAEVALTHLLPSTSG